MYNYYSWIGFRSTSSRNGEENWVSLQENNSGSYVFPVSGKIEKIDVLPKDTTIMLGGNDIQVKELIEKEINKGDTISFASIK